MTPKTERSLPEPPDTPAEAEAARFMSAPTPTPQPVEDNRPKRGGWWQRRSQG